MAVEMNTLKGPVNVDAKILAQHIWEAEGYAGQNIRLLSCNTGAGPVCIAQDLADIMQKTVYAPDNYLWATSQGDLFVSGGVTKINPITGRSELIPVGPKKRELVTFYPQNN